jgi:organic radical activating enzyme
VAVETNGTIPAPKNIDWICVSPKVKSNIVIKEGNEIKVIYPQEKLNLEKYEKLNFEHFYLQPLDNKNAVDNCKKTIEHVLENPKWKLSIQTHKYLGIK